MRTNDKDDYRISRRPSKEDGRIIYPLMRCGPKGFRNAVILSHDILGCYTHYWCRRTIPCRKEGCPACEKGYSPRWHGWVFVQSKLTANKVIFEFTAGGSGGLDKYFREHRTLRAAQINAWREPAKPNGRLIIEAFDSGIESELLPKGIKLLPILMRMWNARFEPASADTPTNADTTAEEIRIHMSDERKTG